MRHEPLADPTALSPIAGFVETAAAFTDAGTLAMLDDVSRSDSVAAALAVDKATNADVKAFARAMMTDHHGLRLEGEQLARALGHQPCLCCPCSPSDQAA